MFKPERFPTGSRRKKTTANDQLKISTFKEDGVRRIREDEIFTWLDSHANYSNYSIKGEGGASFSDSFREILPRGKKLTRYVEETFKENEGKMIGVEFGGVGSNFFRDFSPGFFQKSVGVTLVDHRTEKVAKKEEKENKYINHEILVGDIFDGKTYENLKKSLNGKKVNFLVSRMARGLELVPENPYIVSKALERWYEILEEGGLMFVQFPIVFNNLVEEWAKKIKREYENNLEVKCTFGWRKDHYGSASSSFSLRKLPGSPKELPLLDPRAVHRTKKYR